MKNNGPVLLLGITILFIGLMIGYYIGNATSQNYITLTRSPTESIEETKHEYLTVEINKIDINSATVEELTILPGIGEYTAQQIVEYRENVCSFKSIEDLEKVKGISSSRIENIRKYLYVGG